MGEPTTKSAAKMTRAKAELALSRGADPTLDTFTKAQQLKDARPAADAVPK